MLTSKQKNQFWFILLKIKSLKMFQPNPSTVLKRCNISALPCFAYRLTEYRRRLRYRSYVLIIGRHLWPYIKHQSIIGTMKTHAIPTVPKTVQGIKVRGQRSSGRAPFLVLQQDHNLYPTVTATHSTAAANTSLRAHPSTRDCAGKACHYTPIRLWRH